MSKRIFYLIVAVSLTMSLYGQDVKNLQNKFLEAEYFFMSEAYPDALPFYLELYEQIPDNAFLAYRIGSCFLNIPGKKNLSVSYIEDAREIISKSIQFKEENAGLLFNSEESDFNPVISGDGKSFAWMVSMKFYDAIMFSGMVNGKLSPPVNITPELQSDGDFYISCLSSDNRLLFLSRDDYYSSDIYFSEFNGTSWSKCVKLNMNINTRYLEPHGFISKDRNQLVFASGRPGGFGGLELYISHKTCGVWGSAVNLGPEINTPFNEDRPFLINQGKTLYFSSQGHHNVGGYDIFRSDFQSNSLWREPLNIGYPLNNTDDNFFFMPVDKGNSGYYSKYKEYTGAGKEDIYRIIFMEK